MIARYLLATIVIAALSVVAIIRCTPVKATEPAEVDVAIVFLVDTSYSMDSYELGIARAAHVAAFRSPEIVSAIETGGMRVAVAYVEFGGWASVLVDWTVIGDAASAEAFAKDLEAKPVTNTPQTAIGAALLAAGRQFAALGHNNIRASRLVVDIVGDGMNSAAGKPTVAEAREPLLDRGATINGMPLMLAPSEVGLDHYYETVVIGGPGAFSMPLTNIDQMPAALRQKIVLELY